MPRIQKRKPTWPDADLPALARLDESEQDKLLADKPGKRYGIRHPRQRAFLVAYSKIAHIRRAAEIAGVSRDTVRNWRRRDPVFQAAFEEAQAMAIEELEASAAADALGGMETTRIFLLKSLKPEVYDREKSIRLTTSADTQLGTEEDGLDLTRLSAPELIVYRALRRKALDKGMDEMDERALLAIEQAAGGNHDDDQ